MAKILFLENDLKSLVNFRGGLIKQFVDKKFDVTVCVPPLQNPELLAKLNAIGARFVFIPINNAGLNIFADISYMIALYCLIKKEKFDYLLACRIKPVIYAGLISRVANAYAIITGAGFVLRNKQGKYYFLHHLVCFLYRIALAKMKIVFFQNNDDRDLFVKNKLISLDKTIVVAGSGIDLDEFPVVPLPKQLSFLFAARLLRDKGIIEYVDAARILKKQYPQISFKVAGDIHANPSSISKTQLEAWIKEGVIDYLGVFPSLHQVLAESSVFVLPSYHEGVPRSALEAMSMGRPIITTDAPGCRDLVEQGMNGYKIPIKNVNALVAAMKNFIEAVTLCALMGQKSREIVETKYDVQQVNENILYAMGFQLKETI